VVPAAANGRGGAAAPATSVAPVAPVASGAPRSGGPPGGWLRDRDEPHGHGHRVTPLELFFDLVFVFAVTMVSRFLLEHLTLRGAAQTLLLLVAVWRAWIVTAWLTNWFDPDRRPVRALLVGLMLVSLLMSAALPEAFGGRGLVFAGAYAVMLVGRMLFAVAAPGPTPALRRNFQRNLIWASGAGALWLAGGVATGAAREALWLGAVAIDVAAPAAGFYVPGLGPARTRDWAIAGEHLAERCGLFMIIALGESILVTGATLAGLALEPAVVAAFVVAFLGSVAFWWLYFDRSAESAAEVIARDADPGRLGRAAYTYLHLPMVAGIIVAAAGDELSIAHPGGPITAPAVATLVGGAALFLLGHFLFKRAVFGARSASRLTGLAALAALLPLSPFLTPLGLAGAVTLVLVLVACWDAQRTWRLPAAPEAPLAPVAQLAPAPAGALTTAPDRGATAPPARSPASRG
jgi:low temperature requirement protein LtrA